MLGDLRKITPLFQITAVVHNTAVSSLRDVQKISPLSPNHRRRCGISKTSLWALRKIASLSESPSYLQKITLLSQITVLSSITPPYRPSSSTTPPFRHCVISEKYHRSPRITVVVVRYQKNDTAVYLPLSLLALRKITLLSESPPFSSLCDLQKISPLSPNHRRRRGISKK